MWNLKYNINEPMHETERLRDIEDRLVVAKEEGGGGGIDWEFVFNRRKLLHREWINNKVLLYSTGISCDKP